MHEEKIKQLISETEEIDKAIENLKKTIKNTNMSIKNINNIIITVNSLREDWGDKRFEIFKLKYNIS